MREPHHPPTPASTAPALFVSHWALLPAGLVSLSAVALFALLNPWLGYALMIGGLLAALATDRLGRSSGLLRDLFLISLGLGIISTSSMKAELDTLSMVRFTVVLGGAVAVPFLVQRFVFRERVIRFPWRAGVRWTRAQWVYIVVVVVAGWLILPYYFISTGVYQNWPVVDSSDMIARLFIGVNAVGIWDELFFICTVFALLMRHFGFWTANLLQAVIFVSFLWELGYQAWGPLLTIPFALLQGFIFTRTRSLAYVVTVHLLFDAVVFLVLVSAHNPGFVRLFLI